MKRYIEIWYEVVEMNMWLESEKSNRKIYQVILHYNICSIREIDPLLMLPKCSFLYQLIKVQSQRILIKSIWVH